MTTAFPLPLWEREGAARSGAQRRGRVRGNADGKTKRQLLPPVAVIRARALRRNATEPELKLWRALRETFPSARFRFQVPFGPLPYYADFCSHGAKLIIEVDGDTHASTEKHDANRTAFLNGEGYQVIRFTNMEVMRNVEGVIAAIVPHLPLPWWEKEDAAQRGVG